MAIANQITGINAIEMYSTTIYQDIQDQSQGGGTITPKVGTVLNGAVQVFAAATSFILGRFKLRMIINGGLAIMGVSLLAIAIFAMYDFNDLLVYMMLVYLAVYQYTLGTYTWVYLGAVACDEGLSLATFFQWCPFIPASMFDKLGSSGTFFFFSGGTMLAFLFFHFML